MVALKYGKQKRSAIIGGVRTSIRLEPIFWKALEMIAEEQGRDSNQIIKGLNIDQVHSLSRTGALRCYILKEILTTTTGEA